MSYYAIGDIHGRNDLFQMALNKIDFDETKDMLYILGDVVDDAMGAVPVIQYMMAHENCIKFVMGNHDQTFLHRTVPMIRKVKEDEALKKLVIEANKYCRNPSAEKYLELLNKGNKICFESEKLLRSTRKYRPLIEKELEIASYLEYDKNKMYEIYTFLSWGFQTSRKYNICCGLYEEMFALCDKEFEKIVDFFKAQPNEYFLSYNGKSYMFVHYLRNKEVYGTKDDTGNEFVQHPMPYANYIQHDRPDFVLFGHYPVASCHRELIPDFNYREIFSYMDEAGTHYYNLDLVETDILGIIRLDDMEEFYVTSRSEKPDDKYKIPSISVNDRKTGLIAFPCSCSDEKFVMNFKDFCWFTTWVTYDEKKGRVKFDSDPNYYRLDHRGNLDDIFAQSEEIRKTKHLDYIQSCDAKTDQDILSVLSASVDINVLKNLAANTSTPHEVLLKLSKRAETYIAVAKNPSTSSDILLSMCDLYDSQTFCSAVLKNKNLDSDVLIKLCQNEKFVPAVAKNNAATEAILYFIYHNYNSEKLNGVLLKHPNTPNDIRHEVERRIKDKNEYIKTLREAASNPNTSVKELVELAGISNESIQLAIVKNENASADVLILVMDHHQNNKKNICQYVLNNPNVNNDVYKRILEGYFSSNNCPVEFCKKMLADNQISEENINTIYKRNKSNEIRIAIANHPKTSFALLKKIQTMKNLEIGNIAKENMSIRNAI